MKKDLASYDDNFCLKPPMLLWVALLFLSRAVVVPAVFALMRFTGAAADPKDLFAGSFDVQTLIPSAIAALVLLAALRRKPSASRAVRWIWAHGRTLVALSAMLDFGLSIAHSPLWHGDFNDRADLPLPLLTAAFDLYFLVYVLAARQVRDAFADFPEMLQPSSAARVRD